MRISALLFTAVLAAMPMLSLAADAPAAGPYKIITSSKVGGAGGFDYVFADAAGRKLYIPRGNRVDVYDLDTLKAAGSIADAADVHGAAVSTTSKHGFCSSNPVVMWDTDTLKTVKTIQVQGRPDGILYDEATDHVLILSHSAPNTTVIDAKDGSIVGTIDLGGAPEQGASDGAGHLYISIEDKDSVAVVDAKTLKVTAHYSITGKTGGPAGLAMDVKNHILFVGGRQPATCSVLNADDGTILATLPIGNGVDAAAFNPATMEAFFSTGDGKLTIIKETDPKTFTVEQVVDTKVGAKTCTLDTKTSQVLLITADRAAPATAPATQPATQPNPAGPGGGRPGGRGGRGVMVPDSFTILVVGKDSK